VIEDAPPLPSLSRRAFGRRVCGAAACLLVGPPPEEDDLGGRVDRALASALRALIAAQSPDGAWRSPTYGVFKDGLSLTPPVLKALAFAPDVPGLEDSRSRGAAYLSARVRADGSIDDGPFGMTYPVYTSSASAIALTRLPLPEGPKARDAWLRELRARQITEDLGWSASDPAYGGWGYSIRPPRKPDREGGHPIDADLSSTLFALGALRIAGVPADDPAVRKAMRFVIRCQNWRGPGKDAESVDDDGGFFFSPADPVRNKAGPSVPRPHGRAHYRSYGSATADGLRALLRCGVSPDHPRVAAARLWLERHFSPSRNPGAFPPNREIERESTFFYYAWSVSHAFRTLGIREVATDAGKVAWAVALSREFLGRQRPDGTWANRFTASKEDDPLVATSFAVGALGNARPMIP
jgi:hypothetical protein